MKEGADFSGVTHYTQVDVQPGGINIQNVEHLYQADILKQLGIELEVKKKEDRQPEEVTIPEELANSEPWQKLQDAGLVDEHGQPTVSRPEAALMVYVLAKRLHIANKWKLFEQLWRRNNMRNDYNTALNQQKSLGFQEKLKNILS